MPTTVAKFFAYAHLPEKLQTVSKPIGELAAQMEGALPDGPEKSAGMRKLLEAKDCFVRAALPLFLAALLAGCGSIAGTILPGVDTPAVQEDIAALEADVAEFKADLDAAKVANLPGIESFVAAIAAKDYPGAAIELAVLIPQLKASAPELIQDARAIVADLRHLVSDATGRKAVATAARAAKRATVKP